MRRSPSETASSDALCVQGRSFGLVVHAEWRGRRCEFSAVCHAVQRCSPLTPSPFSPPRSLSARNPMADRRQRKRQGEGSPFFAGALSQEQRKLQYLMPLTDVAFFSAGAFPASSFKNSRETNLQKRRMTSGAPSISGRSSPFHGAPFASPRGPSHHELTSSSPALQISNR